MHRHSLGDHSDVAALDAAVAQQAAGDKFGGVDSDSEAEALGVQNGRGVHAYHTAVGSDQRASRVAGIE